MLFLSNAFCEFHEVVELEWNPDYIVINIIHYGQTNPLSIVCGRSCAVDYVAVESYLGGCQWFSYTDYCKCDVNIYYTAANRILRAASA